MLWHRIALSFDSNLNPFYNIIFSVDGVLSRCTCIKSNDSSLSSIMVDLIADKVLFNFENYPSGSAVFTGNVVRIFNNIWQFGKFSARHTLWSEFMIAHKWPSPMLRTVSANDSYMGIRGFTKRDARLEDDPRRPRH